MVLFKTTAAETRQFLERVKRIQTLMLELEGIRKLHISLRCHQSQLSIELFGATNLDCFRAIISHPVWDRHVFDYAIHDCNALEASTLTEIRDALICDPDEVPQKQWETNRVEACVTTYLNRWPKAIERRLNKQFGTNRRHREAPLATKAATKAATIAHKQTERPAGAQSHVTGTSAGPLKRPNKCSSSSTHAPPSVGPGPLAPSSNRP